MSNPFKEAEKMKKKVPGSGAEKPAEPIEEEKVIAEEEVVEVEEEPLSEASDKVAALIGPAERTKKPKKSTVAVYLSNENQAWLKKTAAQRGKSTSELLDQILTELRG